MYGTTRGNENQGPYNTSVGIKIETICTIILACCSRQLVGRKFDCEISEFIQLVEHCVGDKFISDFCCTLFLLKKIKFSLKHRFSPKVGVLPRSFDQNSESDFFMCDCVFITTH